MDKKLEKLITDILVFTELATPDQNEKLLDNPENYEVKQGKRELIKRNIFPLSYIGAVEPILDPLLEGDGRGYFMDVCPRDVDGRWDVSVISKPDESWGDALFQLARCRRKPLHELRGYKTLSEYAAEHSVAVLKKDGTYTSARATSFYVGRETNGRGRWASIEYSGFLARRDSDGEGIVRINSRPVEDEETSRSINLALGFQFTRDYEWMVTVAVRNVGNPVMLATDSLGARKMFGDRESNGSRRAALEHWVEQHWRRSRKDPDSESFVRQHLRGVEEFVWKGFECSLRPSPYDLRLAKKLEAEREVMKREGKTVRVRSHHAGVVQAVPEVRAEVRR